MRALFGREEEKEEGTGSADAVAEETDTVDKDDDGDEKEEASVSVVVPDVSKLKATVTANPEVSKIELKERLDLEKTVARLLCALVTRPATQLKVSHFLLQKKKSERKKIKIVENASAPLQLPHLWNQFCHMHFSAPQLNFRPF